MAFDPKLLGPFAEVYNRERAKCMQSLKEEQTKWANFAALHKKKNIKFLHNAETKREGRLSEMKENEKKRRSDLHMNGRKMAMEKMQMTGITDDLNNILHEEEDNEISAVEIVLMNLTEKTSSSSDSSKENKNNNTSSSSSSSIASSSASGSTVIKNGNINTANGVRAKQPQQPQPTTSKGPVKGKAKTADDIRREKLLKWKKEKEMANQVAKKNERQPFKAGAAGTARPGTGTAPAHLNQTAKVGAKNTIPPPERRVTRAMAAKTPSMAPPASVVPSRINGTTTAAARTAAAKVEPLQQKFKNLNVKDNKPSTSGPSGTGLGLAGRNTRTVGVGGTGATSKLGPGQSTKPKLTGTVPTTTTSRTGQAPNAPASRKAPAAPSRVLPTAAKAKTAVPTTKSTNPSNVKGGKAPVNLKQKDGDAKAKSSNDTRTQPAAQDTVVAPVAETVVTVKKSKPKGFDFVFIDYNGKLSGSCLKLNEYSNEWHKVLEDSVDIPEKVEGDIRSALGKVNLLLKSKLPQFWELLDAYVRHEGGPEGSSQVLPCDLQGWWDVATIQLDMVNDIFKDLTSLKENNWKEPQPTSNVVKMPSPPKPRVAALPPKPKPAKAASSGLKAFLAQQRKKLQNPDLSITEMETNSSAEPIPIVPAKPAPSQSEDSEFNKTFEGGFFSVNTISSPMPVRVTPSRRRVSELRQSGIMSPQQSRRSSSASHMRMSLCMLGVRRSMGPLSKIGVSVSTPNDGNSGNNDALNSSNQSHASSQATEQISD